ncbi:MAG: rhomboid family intramembrane serine protease [Gammaproteobacteria bacterium]|jgi:membrane associated rhomboid family serine protease
MIPLRDDNPTRLVPVVNYTVMVLCAVVFLWQFSLGARGEGRTLYALGLIPAVLTGQAALPPSLAWVPPPVTVLTSMFLHGGWLHIIGNMLFLWIFGDNVEDAMGHVRYVIFYLLCGAVAAFAQVLGAPGSTVPMIGASGAISGVLGAYLLLHPRAEVLVLVPLGFFLPLMRLPAVWVLGAWFVIQLLDNLFAGPGGAGVAFRAHIGGFLAGLALIPVFKYRRVRLWR